MTYHISNKIILILFAILILFPSCEMIEGAMGGGEEEITQLNERISTLTNENEALKQKIHKAKTYPKLPRHESKPSRESYIGEVILTTADTPADGWAFCDGTKINISQNNALFSIIGVSFGGDGRVTFQLPDYQKLEEELEGARYTICTAGPYPSRN